MLPNLRKYPCLVVVCGLSLAVLAADVRADQSGADKGGKKSASPLPAGDVLGFKMKDHPFALERTFPGVNAALLLTDDQKRRIQQAWQETLGSAEVRKAMATLKTDPKASDPEKEEARKVVNRARERLDEKVAGILTGPQKELVAKLNDAAAEVHKAVGEELEAEFTAAKGDDERMAEVRKKIRERVAEEFPKKVATILTDEQRKAMEEAAARQKAAEAAGKGAKK